jgi:hypothetical protein
LRIGVPRKETKNEEGEDCKAQAFQPNLRATGAGKW